MGSLAMRNPLKGFEKRIERQVAYYVRNPSLATLDPPPFITRQGVGTTLRSARPGEAHTCGPPQRGTFVSLWLG